MSALLYSRLVIGDNLDVQLSSLFKEYNAVFSTQHPKSETLQKTFFFLKKCHLPDKNLSVAKLKIMSVCLSVCLRHVLFILVICLLSS